MRPFTRERIFGVAVAALGLAVVAVSGIAVAQPFSGRTQALTERPAAVTSAALTSPPSAAPAPAPVVPTPTTEVKLPLIVINDSMVAGAAARAATMFRGAGWTVTSVGNLRESLPSTTAYYDPAVPGASDAANALKAAFPGIRRVAPRLSVLPSGPVIVVLTPDWS
jgi:hypothetical protein